MQLNNLNSYIDMWLCDTQMHTCTHIYARIQWGVLIHFVDLYGLLFFLRVEPYVAEIWWKLLLWKPFAEGNWTPMLRTCSKLLWRNSKLDVAEEVRCLMLIGWSFFTSYCSCSYLLTLSVSTGWRFHQWSDIFTARHWASVPMSLRVYVDNVAVLL